MAIDYRAKLTEAVASHPDWAPVNPTTIRRMVEHVTPQWAINAGWWTGATYTSIEFLSFVTVRPDRAPQAVYKTSHVPWVEGKDRLVSFRRALELMATPVTDVQVHEGC